MIFVIHDSGFNVAGHKTNASLGAEHLGGLRFAALIQKGYSCRER